MSKEEIISQFWRDVQIRQSQHSYDEVVWYKGRFISSHPSAASAKCAVDQLLTNILEETNHG